MARDVHRRCRQAALVVAVVALLVFLPSLTAGFVLDDAQLITRNGYVHALEWLPRAFKTHVWDVSPLAVAESLNGAVDTSNRYYRPLITASFLLTWVVVGAKPWLFHLTNVVAHAATAWLATRAAIRWTGSLALGVLIGGLFALHPTRTESVTWIAGRTDVFMLLFVLLALEAFTRFERRRAPILLAAGLLAVVAAILCKEPAVMAPVLLLAREQPSRPRPRWWTAFASVAALGVGYALLRMLFWRPDGEHVVHFFTPTSFLFTLGVYAHRAVAPWPPTMFYDLVPFDAAGAPIYRWPFLVLGGAVAVVVAATLVLAWRRSRTAFWLLVGAACFMGPLLNLFNTGTKDWAHDRFLYAPLLFGAAGVARLLRQPLRQALRKRAFWFLAAGVALTAIALVELRTLDYRDDETFCVAELASNPHDPYLLQTLGRSAASRGDLEQALGFYRRADLPESRRYQYGGDAVLAHFEEAALLGAMLPDGRIDDLHLLVDELWRTVEPSKTPLPGMVAGLAVGRPMSNELLKQHERQATFHWDAALLATRTGDFRRAEAAVRAIPASRTAAHPLNGVLVLARLGHLAEARQLAARIRALASFRDVATAREFDALAGRLDRAERMALARDGATTPKERHVFEALRLAELGAVWSALRVLGAASLLDDAETGTLTLQLLVACRLDDAAREYAQRLPDGPTTLAKFHAELPAALKGVPPVPTPLERVVAAAMRPL